jgi:dynein heavy chain, axonemal
VVGTAGVAMQRYFTLASMASGIPLMVLGPRGCGKSCASLDLLAALNPEEHLTNVCVLSGGTSAEQLQQTVVGRLDRRRKGVFGPPMGRKCVLLVDGIADHQEPAELLRQWLANGHWYNTDNTKVELVDVVSGAQKYSSLTKMFFLVATFSQLTMGFVLETITLNKFPRFSIKT